MRTSTIMSVSLPPAMVKDCERVAKQSHMTRSELFRSALRRYLEETKLEEALHAVAKARKNGTMRVLKPGGLARLLKQS